MQLFLMMAYDVVNLKQLVKILQQLKMQHNINRLKRSEKRTTVYQNLL